MKDQNRDRLGPKPDHLTIDEENWEEAVKKALKKKPQEEGGKADEKSQ